MWFLGTEPKSFRRVSSAHNHRAISAAPQPIAHMPSCKLSSRHCFSNMSIYGTAWLRSYCNSLCAGQSLHIEVGVKVPDIVNQLVSSVHQE